MREPKLNYEWPEIKNLAMSNDPHHRCQAIAQAQLHLEKYLNDEGILRDNNTKACLSILVDLGIITEAAELVRLQRAVEFRNSQTHGGEIPSRQKAIEIVSAFKVFLYRRSGMYHLLKEEHSSIAEHMTLSSSDSNTDVRLPPPPNVSYHPDFYVCRGLAEKRALNCLLHPNTPVVVQAPTLFGKRAFIGKILQVLNEQKNSSIIRINGKKIHTLADLKSQIAPDYEQKELNIEDLLKHCLRSKSAVLYVIVEQSDLISASVLRAFKQISEFVEEQWSRLRVLFTASSSQLELKSSGLFCMDNCICLEEFSRAQVEELAALHRIPNTSVDSLWHLVGGHPFLIRLGLYEAFMQNISLSNLTLQADIFTEHKKLLENSIKLTHFSSITARKAFQKFLSPSMTVDCLSTPSIVSDFYKQGLLKQVNGNYQPRCLLYKELLLSIDNENNSSIELQKLEAQQAEDAQKEEARKREEAKRLEEVRKERFKREEEARRQEEVRRIEELKRIEEFKEINETKICGLVYEKQGLVYKPAPQKEATHTHEEVSLNPKWGRFFAKVPKHKKINIREYNILIYNEYDQDLSRKKEFATISLSGRYQFTSSNLRCLKGKKLSSELYTSYRAKNIPVFSIQFYIEEFWPNMIIIKSDAEIRMHGILLETGISYYLSDEIEYTIAIGGLSWSMVCVPFLATHLY